MKSSHATLLPLPQRSATPGPCLALFDFDGTLTTHDSVLQFVRFAKGPTRYYAGMLVLLPLLVSYLLGVIDNTTIKRRLLLHFFKGTSEASFNELARRFSLQQLPRLLRPAGLQRLREHRRRGDEVAIVSSSLENWLEAWCRQEGVQLIATRVTFQQGVFAGDFVPDNCYGPEKVRRITERYQPGDFSATYAYGDSQGDREMLAWATHAFYRVF